MKTDTSEKGLEDLILAAMTGRVDASNFANEPLAPYGLVWQLGDPHDYDREYAVDIRYLYAFLSATQPEIAEALELDQDTPVRRKFLARLHAELNKHGVIHLLRHGLKHEKHTIEFFYGTPSAENLKARDLFASNCFTVTRQLRYSREETRRALDLAIFINGLPIATFELKNRLTKQTVRDAVEQYKRDRDHRETLFSFGRCMVHFALDEHEVMFCTDLKGKASWFLPFNRGWNDGAGNPPNPNGIQTDYLWKQVLTPEGLTDIIENYAQIVETKNERTGKKKRQQIFPRYHQLDVVRSLVADATFHGIGRKYLIQHSAGSGKSNSIAWLAYQLTKIKSEGKDLFDSIIVITDRRILDKQIRDTIKQFSQVNATIGAVTEGSQQLRQFIESGKKIIISTVQKFPFILDEIGSSQREKRFAILIDEAHSSQGGKASAAISSALGKDGEQDEEETTEDKINRLMESKKLLKNASYFAFTATPKSKTLEMFGERLPADAEGKVKHKPFHSYSMKQAIEEGFIVDVLKHYTPVESYYKLVKKIEGDPEFDTKRAKKKLRRYVESHEHAIRLKAEIMVDHFHEQVIAHRKIGGEARAMVVCASIERAIQYFHAFKAYLIERKSPYQAIVAFSGEHDDGGLRVTESTLNGFPSSDIAEKIQEAPYRFLICADKFQTGYDEPLLHTMYVDKPLSGVKAVQTLSRLNRANPEKYDAFILDFMNNTETVTHAFSDYYRTTILSEETDPNRLHDLKATLDAYQIYDTGQINSFVQLYLDGIGREQLEPILNESVESYRESLDEDGQIDFKGKAKAFTRAYDFLASILPYTQAEWECLSIFLNFLIPKLPAPIEEDFAKGILETIDMDSYRAEKKSMIRIQPADENAEITPIPTDGGGRKAEPEFDRLSSILKTFNEHFGTVFGDSDRVVQRIRDDIAPKVASDPAYQNAKKNTPNTAKLELDKALQRVMIGLLSDDTEVYKQFVQNESFKRFVSDMVYDMTREAS